MMYPVLTLTIFLGVISLSAMTLSGYYTWKGVMTGIRSWAFEESGYNGAAVKIVEGNYSSGWITGRDVSAEKINNPLVNCYKYHTYY